MVDVISDILESNKWESDLKSFMKKLNSMKDKTWWVTDMQLKYLNLTIDTRNNRFILKDHNNTRITPDRVLKAILKYENETLGKYYSEPHNEIVVKVNSTPY